MKAALVKAFDGPAAIAIEDIPEPQAQAGEVVVAVRAAALNFFDTLMARNRYQHTPPLPYSPGAEIAGTIAALGPGVTGWDVGERVHAFIGWNGCRERTVARADALIRVPDGVSDAVAAGLTVTYGTAMHALGDRAHLKPGETVAVLGASGGAGLAAVEIAKLMGARVIAAASSPEKLDLCRQHGADALVNYAEENLRDRLKALTEGAGADVIYDCVGGAYSEAALRATAWAGRFLVVGFASGEIPKVPLNLALLKGCAIVGVFWGAFAERSPAQARAHIEQVMAWVADGRLAPHIHHVYALEETRAALEALDQRQARGKVVVKT